MTDAEFARRLVDHLRYSSVYDQEQVYRLEPGQYGLIGKDGGQYHSQSGREDYPVIEASIRKFHPYGGMRGLNQELGGAG